MQSQTRTEMRFDISINRRLKCSFCRICRHRNESGKGFKNLHQTLHQSRVIPRLPNAISYRFDKSQKRMLRKWFKSHLKLFEHLQQLTN